MFGFLQNLGKSVAKFFSVRCPKCDESDYDKKEVNVTRGERFGRAYRANDGALLSFRTNGCVETQAKYIWRITTYEWTCKRCGHKWESKYEEEAIA